MLLIKLEGEFFGQYKKLGPIYFPENNVIGILGPNGAGKSTIFSAIELALYGNASHIKMSEIKNHDATKGQKWWVELIFELGGFQYKVFRHETTSKAYLSVNGKTIQMGQTEVTEHIENAVLQMDQVAFSNAFYAKQDEFDQLNRLTNEQRKKQISKLLKVNYIDKAIENLRVDKNRLDTQTKEQSNYISDPIIFKEQKEELFSKLKVGKKEMEGRNKDVLSTEKTFEVLKKQLAKLEKDKELFVNFVNEKTSFEKEIDFIMNSSLPSMNEQLKQMQTELDLLPSLYLATEGIPKLEKKIVEQESLQQQFEQLKTLEEQNLRNKNHLQQKKKQLDELKNEVELLTKVISNISKSELVEKIENLKEKIRNKENEIAVKSKEVADIKQKGKELREEINKLSTLGENSTCPTCSQTLGEHLPRLVKSLESEIKELLSKHSSITSSMEEDKKNILNEKEILTKQTLILQGLENSENKFKNSENNLKQIQQEFRTLRNDYLILEERIKQFSSVSFDKEGFIKLKNQLKELYQKQESIRHIEINKTKMNRIEQEKAIQLNKISSNRNSVEKLDKKLDKLEFDVEDFNSTKVTYDEIYQTLRIVEKEKSELTHHILITEKEIKVIEEKEENNNKLLESSFERKKEFAILLHLEGVLQKYKTKQLSSLAPTIAGIMKNYLSYLTEGKYDLVELDEHYNIFVYRNNIRQPFHLFSGGEKKLISLVQRLAISQILISKTSKKKFEFLAFDEALGMLDEDRQTNIVETLEKLTSKFSQIFLISHSSTIHDMFKYRLMVKQNADLSSTIYWENEWDEEAIKEKIIL